MIPGEEVKTDNQGEVIGLFLHEEIPRGMTFAETIAAIREQDGIVYVPHPFDRMHAIPSPATLLRHLPEIDVLEVYNARLLFDAYNDEALRFQRKYGLLAGAGSDAHVLQGVGTGALRMRRFDGPEEFLLSLRTRRGAAPTEVARLPAVAQVGRAGQGEGPLEQKVVRSPVTAAVPTDEIYERYLRKAIGEINELQHELLALADETHVPVLGSGHPLGDVFLLKHAPQPAEITEGVAFFGRSGNALLKSLQRLARRPARDLRHELPQVRHRGRRRRRRPWLTRELHIVQPKLVVVMGDDAVAFLDALAFPLADPLDGGRAGGRAALHADDRGARDAGHRRLRSTSRPRRRRSGTRSRRSGRGGRSCRRTEPRGGLLPSQPSSRALVAWDAGAGVLPERRPLAGRPRRRARRAAGHVRRPVARAARSRPTPARPAGRGWRSSSCAVLFDLAGLDSLFNVTKLLALTAIGFLFMQVFEALSWVVLIALIIPWVDALSVWRGPTDYVVSEQPSLFDRISIAFRLPGEEGSANIGPPDILFFALFLATAAPLRAAGRLDVARDGRPARR